MQGMAAHTFCQSTTYGRRKNLLCDLVCRKRGAKLPVDCLQTGPSSAAALRWRQSEILTCALLQQ